MSLLHVIIFNILSLVVCVFMHALSSRKGNPNSWFCSSGHSVFSRSRINFSGSSSLCFCHCLSMLSCFLFSSHPLILSQQMAAPLWSYFYQRTLPVKREIVLPAIAKWFLIEDHLIVGIFCLMLYCIYLTIQITFRLLLWICFIKVKFKWTVYLRVTSSRQRVS